MKFFTSEECRSWCKVHQLEVTADRYLRYGGEHPLCFTVKLDDKPNGVIGLADYLIPTWDDLPFEGALLWIREKGVWSDFSEHTGAMIVQQMRLAKGETAPLGERPGQLFGPEELLEMHSYFLIPLLFGWDAFLVPQGRGYFIFVSHDGFVEVVSRSAEILEQVRQRVIDWSPQEDQRWYAKHVSS